MATNLYEYYSGRGKALPKTAEERFADPNFKSAAEKAGYDANTYKVNMGNAGANQAILKNLMGGMQTQATQNTPTETPTTETKAPISSVFNMSDLGGYTTDPDYQTALEIYRKQMRGEDIVDTEKIRSDTLSKFQDRINSLNQIYDQQLAQARQAGVGRVGSGTGILAARGLAGSQRGEAIKEGVLTQNREIESAIDAERQARIAEIFTQVNSTAAEEAARRRTAMEGGATKYIEHLKNQDAIKESNVNKTAASLVAQGIDPSTMSPEELNSIASKLKVGTSTILSAYKTAKATANKADLETKKTQAEIDKINADIKKGKLIEVNEGNMLYDVETGKTIKNPKTSAPSSTGEGGIYDMLDYRTANAVIAQGNSFGTSDIVKKYNNIVAASNLIAAVDPNTSNPAEHQAVVYNFAKALDPDSVVREGEYATVKKYSQNLIKQYGGEIRQAIKGTGFLSPEAIQAIQDATDNRIKAYEPQYTNLKNQTKSRINSIAGKDVADIVLLDYEQGYSGNSKVITAPDGTQVIITD